MQEYIDLGHMKKVASTEKEQGKYYIPHQAVIREESTTTKLRVVFDASCKSSNGISLNEKMHVGPRLQQVDILIRWRKHKVVFTADIEKMYRQIRIQSEDQEFQRILWRFDKSEPMEEYRLTTVTYDTVAAPYLAIRTLQQLATDEVSTFPKAAEVTMKDFYVDDLISGAKTTKEGVELQNQLINMLKTGGFTLRKWCSNKQELIESLPQELREQFTVEISKSEVRKSLGIHWAPQEDTIQFRVMTTQLQQPTKRSILSEISKLYDPLGLIAPVILKAKLFIQELWLKDINWDTPVPDEIKEKWNIFYKQLKSVENLSIPLWINYVGEGQECLQLHGFADASEKAYAAVVYVRSVSSTSKVTMTLLTAKSKVAPARAKKTLPRLELCAAVLLAKLIKRTVSALEIKDLPVFAWSDSMITLAWIKGVSTKWKTFVANRVAEINDALPARLWFHIESENNPADVVSRGLDSAKLMNHSQWWHGPTKFYQANFTPEEVQPIEAKEERRQCCQTTIKQKNEIVQRFSSLTKMVRVVSYCRRFINNARRGPRCAGHLTVAEMEATTLQIVKITQKEEMPDDLTKLQQHNTVSRKSNISSLNPFMDKDGIIRVNGRLKNSSMPYNEKFPIILPNHSHLSRLIIKDAHLKTLHGGNQTTLAYVRRKFWIVNAKRSIKANINKCVRFIRYKATAAQQQMGNLPAARITPSPPFTHTGVDYAGPIQIRTSKGRGQKSYKGYAAIFVCLATKAVHIEIVSDMTTDAFIAAFRRFTARRGHCAHVYSDNGTNFVGASNLMKKEIREVMRQTQEELAVNGTDWHFIPPASPHFGGIWEAAVKLMKHHLRRIIGDAKLTYEELTTLVQQIEACLNSRPLWPLTNEPSELAVLTPGHFLIGREMIAPPQSVSKHIDSNLSARWKLLQKMNKDFWKIWSSEYLSQLHQRYKWKVTEENLEIGRLVIIKDDNSPPQTNGR